MQSLLGTLDEAGVRSVFQFLQGILSVGQSGFRCGNCVFSLFGSCRRVIPRSLKAITYSIVGVIGILQLAGYAALISCNCVLVRTGWDNCREVHAQIEPCPDSKLVPPGVRVVWRGLYAGELRVKSLECGFKVNPPLSQHLIGSHLKLRVGQLGAKPELEERRILLTNHIFRIFCLHQGVLRRRLRVIAASGGGFESSGSERYPVPRISQHLFGIIAVLDVIIRFLGGVKLHLGSRDSGLKAGYRNLLRLQEVIQLLSRVVERNFGLGNRQLGTGNINPGPLEQIVQRVLGFIQGHFGAGYFQFCASYL